MRNRRAPRVHPTDLARLALLALPVLALVLLLRNPAIDPQVEVPGFHFAIVTLASLCGVWLAALVLRAAHQLGEARMFLLGLSFLAVAGFFFIHGLLTPGVIVRRFSTGISWAPLLGLLLGSVFLALSSGRARPGRQPRWFPRRKWILLAVLGALAAFLAGSLLFPSLLARHPTSLASYLAAVRAAIPDYGAAPPAVAFPWLSLTLLGISMGLYLLTAVRYARNYRLTRLQLHAAVVVGVALLAESQLSFFFAAIWRISWWEYHVLVLLGFATMLYGLLASYLQGAGLTQSITTLLLDGSVHALERSYTEVLTALVAAVETRDPYTKGHSEKVARVAAQIGEALGLPPEHIRILYHAGLLHDVGKIGIPDAILNKPGRLTPREFDTVKTHPLRSEDIVGRIPSLRPTLEAIRWHHERLDGSGYPDGLRGDAIPLDARIMAVADVYDAMTSGRSYRTAWREAAVLAYLRQEAGRVFDHRCVKALFQTLAQQAEATGDPGVPRAAGAAV